MRSFYQIFTAVIFITTATSNTLAAKDQSKHEKCYDINYKKSNPDKCASFFNVTTAPLLSGATVFGGALALISIANATNNASSNPTKYYQPTLPTYNMVGGDVDSIKLAAATSTPEYTQNINQYNDIRLGYSIARGYTGLGTKIAILDSGPNTFHGSAVEAIASGPIAKNAVVESYDILYKNEFLSYDEIGDVIATASDADIFNASWSVSMQANKLSSRNQLIKLTGENFVNQISAAAQRGAIFVWAAGNDYGAQSSALSALPIVMPELNGHFVNVVAWDSETGALAEYSNACGITKNWCITAPGTNINTENNTIVSGTSFAAPKETAAIAVIREAFPYMSSQEITSLLFETARDLGELGIDDIYGHGMLDLERATRPVGAPLVPMEDGTMQILQPARVSGTLAHNILSASPKLAYFDKYGRAFNADLKDLISIKNPGIGFKRLRQKSDIEIIRINNFEAGLKNSDLIVGDGFLNKHGSDWLGFIGTNNEFSIGTFNLFQRARLSFGTPKIDEQSMIQSFSNIYALSFDIGAKITDWSFGISIPDTIINGSMEMRLPIGRANDGAIIYKDYNIKMNGRPPIEYSISYKSITASFVDNPYGTDEFFILTRGKLYF